MISIPHPPCSFFGFRVAYVRRQIKRHVKTKHDFNPLPRFETSSIRVSWRKPGLHRASPSLRDFPSSFASLQKSGLTAAFLFPCKIHWTNLVTSRGGHASNRGSRNI